jgi:addiction module RelB/DinJ family antitoxin
MKTDSTLVRARVPTHRLRKAEKILDRLGLKSSDAINMLLAQIELHQGLPFEVALKDSSLQSSQAQAQAWTEAFGEY